MANTTYNWVSEQRLLYFTQKLKEHFPKLSSLIDDTTAAATKTYSSQKIEQLIAAIDLTDLIDDSTTTATDKTWSAVKIANALAAAVGMEFVKPAGGVLPATGENGKIYLIPNSGSSGNIYDEYVWIAGDNAFEKIGSTDIDLSGYVQDSDMVEITTAQIDAIMATVFV